ncbi:Tfiih basal transcription factor complex p44 subunit [Daphnia magna]|uniref:Tfiih basal transcription factor complex p44 subunit n=1 Tax=Daphnia magna TaxID=35525 RepID=A0A164JSG6_9CRUS|nr:Tfiih basal transcription factor complex p44 subunit [Daphnia magna]
MLYPRIIRGLRTATLWRNCGLLSKILGQSAEERAMFYLTSVSYRAVKHPTLHVLHKCENLICVQVGLLRLQRLMEKPTSSC